MTYIQCMQHGLVISEIPVNGLRASCTRMNTVGLQRQNKILQCSLRLEMGLRSKDKSSLFPWLIALMIKFVVQITRH